MVLLVNKLLVGVDVVKGKLTKSKRSRRRPASGTQAARAGAAAKRRLAKMRKARSGSARMREAAEAAARARSAAREAAETNPAAERAKRVVKLQKKRRKTLPSPSQHRPAQRQVVAERQVVTEREVHYDQPYEAPVITQSVNVEVVGNRKSRCCCCLPTMIFMLCPIAVLAWIATTLV